MQCLILAGGLGTRLNDLTQSTPKTLVTIAERPFADYQLRQLKTAGVTEVIYSIGHLGQQIRDFVGDGAKWGLGVRYVDEGPNLKGTGGALRAAYDADLLSDYFVTIYGDSYLPISIAPVYRETVERRLPVNVTVIKNEGSWDRSNCHVEEGMVQLYSKDPSVMAEHKFHYIDYGLSVWNKRIVAGFPVNQKLDLARVFEDLSRRQQLYAFEVYERFYEIGSVEGLESFEKFVHDHLLNRRDNEFLKSPEC